MRPQIRTFDRRDALSLTVMLISTAASIVYWFFLAGQAAYTYNAFPDALYRYLVEPVMLGSAAFFLASHLHARIAAKASTLHAAKTVCLLLVAVYIVCLGAVIAFGTAMAYELLVAFMGYMQVFLRFAPVFIGAILGIRMAER